MVLVQKEIQRITMYPDWVTEKQLRPAGWWWWQPWANTLAYYDFETDTSTLTNKASTWSTYNGTYYNTPTIWTLASGKKYFNCSWNNYAYTPVLPFNWSGFTLNMRIYVPTQNHERYVLWTWAYNISDYKIFEWCYNWTYQIALGNYTYSTNYSNLSWWKLHTLISNGSNIYIYINGEVITQQTYSTSKINTDNFGIWMLYEQKHQTAKCFEWYFGCVMFEDKVRTQQEISAYYDQTKWDYWIVNLQSITPNISPDIIPDTPNNWTWDVLTI